MDITCRGGSTTAVGMDNSGVGGMDIACRGGSTSFAAMDITNNDEGGVGDASVAAAVDAAGGNSSSKGFTLGSSQMTWGAVSGAGMIGQSGSSRLTISHAADGRFNDEQQSGNDDGDDGDGNASFDGGATATMKFRYRTKHYP
jgi:hypothetical protein